MHHRRFVRAVIGPALLMTAIPGVAALRCGTELVSEGESVLKLLEHCGEPASGDPALYLGRAEWTYNFGPNEFMYRVVIQDGEVERIEELGRGVAQPLDEDDTELDE